MNMTNSQRMVLSLFGLGVSIASIFYVIWVHQTVWNWFIPHAFPGAPAITFFQAFVLGIVGSTFWSSHLPAMLEVVVTQKYSKDEKIIFRLMKTLSLPLVATMELAVACIVKSMFF